MKSNFKILEVNKVHDGSIIDVFADTVELPNGNVAVREYVHHAGAVAILPVDDDGTIYLIEQFRYAARGNVVEVPAGTLEDGEDRDVCAARELTEEIGFRAGDLEHITTFYVAVGYSDERISLYRATKLEKAKRNLDENEILEVRPMLLGDALGMIEDGRIQDSKTIVALYYEKVRRDA